MKTLNEFYFSFIFLINHIIFYFTDKCWYSDLWLNNYHIYFIVSSCGSASNRKNIIIFWLQAWFHFRKPTSQSFIIQQVSHNLQSSNWCACSKRLEILISGALERPYVKVQVLISCFLPIYNAKYLNLLQIGTPIA
jgi:hypothetical protein